MTMVAAVLSSYGGIEGKAMSAKLHTMSEARLARQRIKEQLQDVPGVSLGIGQTDSGNDYAVLVLVEDEGTARRLPPLSADVPVKLAITGKIAAY
ncbi:hypothetical protein [Aurantimonas sp. 22II-16-19i]|uniref:hypothetical protein n=1 Tax=Aurantimonas sp. 22II-16-19i TaxID=1317114 RepID=UPI0009F7C6FF|nr:hypothetical protein [Aurantimonas sp. 22II-16-19i]ORE92790.1 hypothetical protein ATO4_16395 [Aurantimonas sp. 22II-16-19i]